MSEVFACELRRKVSEVDLAGSRLAWMSRGSWEMRSRVSAGREYHISSPSFVAAVLDLRIIKNTEGFRALAFAPDGKLVSASTDCIAIWEARAYDASEWEQVEGPFPGAVDFCEEPDESVVKYWRNTVTDDVRREKSSAGAITRCDAGSSPASGE